MTDAVAETGSGMVGAVTAVVDVAAATVVDDAAVGSEEDSLSEPPPHAAAIRATRAHNAARRVLCDCDVRTQTSLASLGQTIR